MRSQVEGGVGCSMAGVREAGARGVAPGPLSLLAGGGSLPSASSCSWTITDGTPEISADELGSGSIDEALSTATISSEVCDSMAPAWPSSECERLDGRISAENSGKEIDDGAAAAGAAAGRAAAGPEGGGAPQGRVCSAAIAMIGCGRLWATCASCGAYSGTPLESPSPGGRAPASGDGVRRGPAALAGVGGGVRRAMAGLTAA
jgi:hypothetical protein